MSILKTRLRAGNEIPAPYNSYLMTVALTTRMDKTENRASVENVPKYDGRGAKTKAG
jgi:hypothetical protein